MSAKKNRLHCVELPRGVMLSWKFADSGEWERDGEVCPLHLSRIDDEDMRGFRLIIGPLAAWLAVDPKWQSLAPPPSEV